MIYDEHRKNDGGFQLVMEVSKMRIDAEMPRKCMPPEENLFSSASFFFRRSYETYWNIAHKP